MALIDRRTKSYAAPATLKAHEPEWDIRARYGPTQWQLNHACYVRGVCVDKLMQVDGHPGYVWCRFPDERIMIVSERNIKAVLVNRPDFKGNIDVNAAA